MLGRASFDEHTIQYSSSSIGIHNVNHVKYISWVIYFLFTFFFVLFSLFLHCTVFVFFSVLVVTAVRARDTALGLSACRTYIE